MNIEIVFLLVFFVISATLSTAILTFSFLFGDKLPDQEKVSVYECGFDPIHNPGEPLSIRFFLIAILFLIFDLEISYLFPWSNVSSLINVKGQHLVGLFITILTVGLVYEWIRGGLDWE